MTGKSTEAQVNGSSGGRKKKGKQRAKAFEGDEMLNGHGGSGGQEVPCPTGDAGTVILLALDSKQLSSHELQALTNQRNLPHHSSTSHSLLAIPPIAAPFHRLPSHRFLTLIFP